MEDIFYCTICGKRLNPSSEMAVCSFCGKKEKADYICPEGHYVCEECRIASPVDLIKRTCGSSAETDPMKIALLLMKHPAIPMFGPEHHHIVSCALLTAIKNVQGPNIGSNLHSAIERSIKRGEKFVYGSCGLLGVCGAAAGVGIAVSVATHATYMSDKERSLSMQAVSKTLERIAEIGGPRCCKASTFLAIETGVELFKRELGIALPNPVNPKPCIFKVRNEKECLKDRCPYF